MKMNAHIFLFLFLLILINGAIASALVPSNSCAPSPGTIAGGMLTINDGYTSTQNLQVNLKIARDGETGKMKISDNDRCECGTWEPFIENKIWTLPILNAKNFISIQFKDYDGVISQCSRAWIIHSTPLPPTVKLTLNSANTYRAEEDTMLKLEISGAGNGNSVITCKLNGIMSNCSEGVSDIVFQKQAAGKYLFAVTASNSSGKTNDSISWEMNSAGHSISQNVEISSNNKVDILIVDDNSASMEYEQKNMAARMNTFLNQIQGLDWRIALITTDPKSKIWGDGRLLPLKGLANQFMITSLMPTVHAQKILGETIQRSETGSSVEQGIFGTYRAIERSLDAVTSPNKSFFRSDANLATIVISDEDESSNGPKNKPENLISFIKMTWPSKKFAFHSIVTKSGDIECQNTNGNTVGATYEKLSKLTGAGTVGGAIIGSVCETDYGTQLKGIGNSVQQMQKIMNLQCSPMGPSNSSVVLSFNGNNFIAPYEVQGLKLVFKTNLPIGKYLLQYQCL